MKTKHAPGQYGRYESRDEMRAAMARLAVYESGAIGAARELSEAVSDAARNAETLEEVNDALRAAESYWTALGRRLDRARAAIAKATGGQP